MTSRWTRRSVKKDRRGTTPPAAIRMKRVIGQRMNVMSTKSAMRYARYRYPCVIWNDEAEVDRLHASRRDEGDEAADSAELELEAEDVLEDDLDDEDEQHHTGGVGKNAVDREGGADAGEVGCPRGRRH